MINYTTEELISYLYNETSEEQGKAIEKAMEADWNLRDEYNMLKESMQQLDNVLESPRPQSIMAILEYARTTTAVEQ